MLVKGAFSPRMVIGLGRLTGYLSKSFSAAVDKKETVTVTDNRTGKSIDIPINRNTIKAEALSQLKSPEGAVLRSYDPGYLNTASATSRICYINGDKGILHYRGYPIEQLAEKATFLEVAFLILYGELPSKSQLATFTQSIAKNSSVPEGIKDLMKSFRHDAHPMGMIISTMAALSTFHPEANPALSGQDVYKNQKLKNQHVYNILGAMPTIAALAYRHRTGRGSVEPSGDVKMGYAENFLFMLDKSAHRGYKPHPALVKALDILFILHADHELNCSTAAMRHLASSGVDVYTCLSGATAALYGPLHGGANEAVLRMLEKIGSVEKIPQFIEGVKSKKEKLMGFGHRVYKNYDPRAKIVRQIANEVFDVLGKDPLIEIATALEKIALEDKYFVDRKLYPNVDFYSGLIYKAMGFPTDFFTVLFAVPRTVGWLAHWSELLDDPENKIIRPRQVYVGEKLRDYVPSSQRPSEVRISKDIHGLPSTNEQRRSEAGKQE